jgi:hypothetical protein
MRKIFVGVWISLLFGGITMLFWYNEWIYDLPTPIPANRMEVNLGNVLDIRGRLTGSVDKPMLIHFFNPDCPCSRFNIPHFKSLIKKYGDRVNFTVVPLILKGQHYTSEEIQKKFGMDVTVLFDSDLAALCGVYSTPQAVIINSDNTLFYRGNYNRSRYCTDKKSNYAQFALDALLKHNGPALFSPLALQAYGCQIPNCTK